MRLENVPSQIQADDINLYHGLLPVVALNTTNLAHLCRRETSTPLLENHDRHGGAAPVRERRAVRARRAKQTRRLPGSRRSRLGARTHPQ